MGVSSVAICIMRNGTSAQPLACASACDSAKPLLISRIRNVTPRLRKLGNAWGRVFCFILRALFMAGNFTGFHASFWDM